MGKGTTRKKNKKSKGKIDGGKGKMISDRSRDGGFSGSIYFWGYNRNSEIEWYTFNAPTRNDGGKECCGRLYAFETTGFSKGSTCVALGHTIYCLGGDFPPAAEGSFQLRPTNEVRCFDTTRPENGWMKVPSMIVGRSWSQALAFEGKIYVFGGTFWPRTTLPWAEVFDPYSEEEESKWHPIPPAPSMPYGSGLVTAVINEGDVDSSEQKIIVGDAFNYIVYAYDSMNNYWEQMDYRIDFGPCNGCQPAVIGRMLYWYDMPTLTLRAYDLDRTLWSSCPIVGLEQVGTLQHGIYNLFWSLFPFSGASDDGYDHLCLLWNNHGLDKDFGLRPIHCTKIRVSKGIDSQDVAILSAFAEYSRSHLIDYQFQFLGGLLL